MNAQVTFLIGVVSFILALPSGSSEQDPPKGQDTVLVRAAYQAQLERELSSVRNEITQAERRIAGLKDQERLLQGMLLVVRTQRDSLIRFPKDAFARQP